MKVLHTEIEIQASKERVWQLLTNFDDFPRWNPFIRRVQGEIKVGAKIEAFIQPSGASGITIKPTILVVEPYHQLSWLGRLLLPGLVDGEHSFTIDVIGENRVRFTQQEKFTGIFVPLIARRLDDGTLRGFKEMNQALKAVAEEA